MGSVPPLCIVVIFGREEEKKSFISHFFQHCHTLSHHDLYGLSHGHCAGMSTGMSRDVQGCPGMSRMSWDVQGCPGMSWDVHWDVLAAKCPSLSLILNPLKTL